MKITYRKASSYNRAALLAADALRARLYVPGWMLNEELRDIRSGQNAEDYKTCIVVAYLGEVAIGICTSRKWRGYTDSTVMIFVRKKHRRCGIGTKLIKKATSKIKGSGSGGIAGADKFWDKVEKKS